MNLLHPTNGVHGFTWAVQETQVYNLYNVTFTETMLNRV